MNENINSSDNVSVYNKNIIATITHDLKSPAIAQIRALELLLKGNFGEVNESQKNFIQDIINSSNNMLDMLINMLWLYKFENTKVALNLTNFNINELIRDIFNENKLMFNSKNQKFEKFINQKQQNIIADKMHIKRIMTNFIINAVLHSKENSTIYICTEADKKDFIFKVKNYGHYISDETLKCIFDKNKVFTQKCNGLSTGLGLYLSNSLLELNEAKILYKSEKDGLNTFGFTIKLPVSNNKEIDRNVVLDS